MIVYFYLNVKCQRIAFEKIDFKVKFSLVDRQTLTDILRLKPMEITGKGL